MVNAMDRRIFSYLLLGSVLSLSGVYFALYNQAQSELQLAELKSDVEAMYQPLKILVMLRVPSADTKLLEITDAIKLHEEMLRAVADHDHESAVNAAASLLKLFPQDKDAIRTLRESGQIFYLLTEARQIVTVALNSKEPIKNSFRDVSAFQSAQKNWKEKRFHDVNKALELTNAAVKLDPRFETAINLSENLEKTAEAISLLLAEQVIQEELQIISTAAQGYDAMDSVLSYALRLPYISVSDAYGLIRPKIEEARIALNTIQSDVDYSMRLISTYHGTRSKEYFDALREYVKVVSSGIDALLEPTGNLMQFRQIANDTVQNFKKVSSNINITRPNSAELDETVSGLIRVVGEYKIFEYSETEQIINQNTNLYKPANNTSVYVKTSDNNTLSVLENTERLAIKKEEASNIKLEEKHDLERLSQEWVTAHLSKNITNFSELYDDSVLFYGKRKNRNSILESKLRVFKKYPDLQQEIIGEILLEKQKDGSVKSSFTKRVRVNKNQGTTDYPAYLIFKKTNDAWKIAVESDLAVDKNISKNNANNTAYMSKDTI
jgi:hypothetical protein